VGELKVIWENIIKIGIKVEKFIILISGSAGLLLRMKQ
jgi:hypothetical protein